MLILEGEELFDGSLNDFIHWLIDNDISIEDEEKIAEALVSLSNK